MTNGKFKDGTQQLFHYPEGHVYVGQFKGIANILAEKGHDVKKRKAQCGKKFSDCSEEFINCCCCRILFNEPDFKNVNSILETDIYKTLEFPDSVSAEVLLRAELY